MWRPILTLALLSLATHAFAGETTIVYEFTSDALHPNAQPRHGHSQTTATIDGPRFRNVAQLGNAVELSDDDGRTTYFGAFHTTPQMPLGPDGAATGDQGNLGPISGGYEDEQLTVGWATDGPTLFGLQTRVYTVDYRYTVVARLAGVPFSHHANEEHYAITTADVDVSSAALRVALSRGYGHALSKHPEAFVGLPLRIDGTLGSRPDMKTTIHVEATSFTR
jgi:hypothetical protein